jgi:hypothetical protein
MPDSPLRWEHHRENRILGATPILQVCIVDKQQIDLTRVFRFHRSIRIATSLA